MKKYITPEVKVVVLEHSAILCNSDYNFPNRYICESICKHWHFCQDRQSGKTCYDKKY